MSIHRLFNNTHRRHGSDEYLVEEGSGCYEKIKDERYL